MTYFFINDVKNETTYLSFEPKTFESLTNYKKATPASRILRFLKQLKDFFNVQNMCQKRYHSFFKQPQRLKEA